MINGNLPNERGQVMLSQIRHQGQGLTEADPEVNVVEERVGQAHETKNDKKINFESKTG